MMITTICAILAGITGFVAGLTVELVANSKTLQDLKDENAMLRKKIALAENRESPEPIEIIEINTTEIPQSKIQPDYFKPW